MDTLADRLEQVIAGVLDRHNDGTTPNKTLSELIRLQVAKVFQNDAMISRDEPSAGSAAGGRSAAPSRPAPTTAGWRSSSAT